MINDCLEKHILTHILNELAFIEEVHIKSFLTSRKGPQLKDHSRFESKEKGFHLQLISLTSQFEAQPALKLLLPDQLWAKVPKGYQPFPKL